MKERGAFGRLVLAFLGIWGLTFFLSDWNKTDAARQHLVEHIPRVEKKILSLGELLTAGRLSNGRTLKRYADRLVATHPESVDLIRALSVEATRDGRLYQGLLDRIRVLRQSIPGDDAKYEAFTEPLSELERLADAATPSEFNRALADPVNVLADLSDGQLPRVDAVSARAEAATPGYVNYGVGRQLVGNPAYGEWRTESSGQTLWHWFGQYMMFRMLLGGSIDYRGWAGGRGYSYYHDWGRGNYTSPGQRRVQNAVHTRARNKFSGSGRNFASPYARQRQGASAAVARTKMSAPAASSRSASSFGSRSGARGK